MKAIKMRLALGAMLILLLAGVPKMAGALIIIEPIPQQPPNHHALRLAENNVEVKITDRVAEVTAEFVYLNSSNRNLEGTFLFPLPPEAAVDDFSLFVNGEEIKAELLDRGRARSIYESIVRRQQDPALLEFVDRDLLRARIFPITPQDGAKVRLYYTHPIPADFGTADFVYPLSVEKLEAGSDCRISINVELSSSKSLKTVYSPTHTVDVVRPDDNSARITCEPSTAGQRGADFHVLSATTQDDVAANFLTCRDKDGIQYFMGMISPGLPDDDEILPKDVVFCLDRSGSMAGEKIEQAKAALRFCLNSLNDQDHFGLVIFNSDVEIFRPKLDAATADNKDAAARFFGRLPATAGTFIDGALKTSLQMFEDNSRPKYLVFLTDGLPTVGTKNPDDILGHARENNRLGVRVFAWGVGYDLNAGLVNDLAEQGQGVASYVEPGQDIEVEVSHFFEKINRPVLADCRLNIEGVTITEIYPAKLPDLFAGSEVIVVGRYEGSSEVTATLSGRQGTTFKQFVFATEFRGQHGRYGFLPKLWAGRRIGYLLEDMRRHGENDEVIEEVVGLSKRYGIITPYTAFLAAPEEPGLLSWDREYGGRGADLHDDVQASISSQKMKNARIADAAEFEYTPGSKSRTDESRLGMPQPVAERKTAGGKTFVFRGDMWTDAELLTAEAPADTIRIEKFSEAYFELIRQYPEFREYLSVGQQVILRHKNVTIIIADSGETTFRREWDNWLR